jgi:hypothetical protein
MEVPRFSQREGACQRHAARGLGEHPRRFGEQADAGDERLVAHVLPAAA